MPENFFDSAKGEVKGADWRKAFDELTAFKAADDSRRLTLPKSPDEFKIELTKDFKPPEGVDFKVDAANPLWAQARQLMFDVQTGKLAGQDAFSRMADLYAGAQVADQQMVKTARDAEIAKLGAHGPARITALTTWLDAKGAPELKRMLVSAQIVTQFEGLMRQFSSQGSAPNNQNGRDADTGKVEQSTYDSWTTAQKMNYARTGDPNKAA